MKKVIVTAAVVLGLVMSADAAVIFKDTFENKTDGNNVYYGDRPTTGGFFWINNSAGAGAATYKAGVGINGTKALKLFRQVSPSVYPIVQAYTSYSDANGVMAPNGNPFLFSLSWYAPRVNHLDRPSLSINADGTVNVAGIYIDEYNAEYWVWRNGTWVATGVYAQYGVWNKVEILLTPGPDIGGLKVAPKYDVYATVAGQSREVVANGVNSGYVVQTSATTNPRWDLAVEPPVDGISSTVYYDDVVVERIAASQCGDEYHQIMAFDLNKDCMVNFKDFAVIASNWLVIY
jgi:hypothetical protein